MPTATLAELDARLLGGRLENNSAFYTSAERTRALNHGIKVLNLMTGFLQRTERVYTQANRVVYDTPSGILAPLWVTLDGEMLDKQGVFDLSHSHPQWLSETTDNTGVNTRVWVPIGLKKFAIYPGDSKGGKILSVTGVAEPTPLVNPTDVIGYPNEFSDAPIDYGSHLLQVKAGGTVAVQAMYAYQQFIARADELRRWKQKVAPKFRIEIDASE